MTSIAYFLVYRKFIEPEEGKYNWDLIDTAMCTAYDRKQTLMLRIAPYGTEKTNDVPEWYRKVSGETESGKLPGRKWRVQPDNPNYALLRTRIGFIVGGLILDLCHRDR